MNPVLKYSLILFCLIAVISVGVNIFSLTIIETFRPTLAIRILLAILESTLTALILTVMAISVAPVIRELMITMRRLIRFDNLSHPLLVRLAQEAPSTYHHSIMVANLAHKGAKAIAANPILTRVGAYYHDIGKLTNPSYYIENQLTNGETSSIHDQLSPQESVKIITNHVKEGIRLAKEHHLPAEVVNFIPQHHGTSMAAYFYQKAQALGLKVRNRDFRYPGPKPLSKETALVMLADSLESKTRSIAKLTDELIRQTIDEVITDKLDDDQLELSGLTARDLTILRRVFFEAITVIHHRRIRYPQG